MGLLFGGFCCFMLMMMMMMMGSDGSTTRVLKGDDVTTAADLLMGFKKSSVVLDPTGFLSDWNSSNPCCSWRGVSCDAPGVVSSLDLTNAGLIGPLHLPYLTSLRRLFLHGNHFSAGDLSSVSSTARPCLVEIIDLSSNNLTTTCPPFLLLSSSCHNLTSLNLSNNHISGSSNLTALPPSLLQLDLSNNLISHFQLSNNNNLILLNFSHNNLTTTEFLNFSQCNNLSVLDLSHNNLSGGGDIGFLTNCQLLETLDLSHNQLHFQIPGVLLGNLNNLRRLSLAHNLFYGEIPPELGNTCGTLEDLDLSGNKLTGGLFPLNFASCSSLRTLNLGNNQLYYDADYFITTVISHLPSLRYLYLPFNNLSGPVPLSSLLLTNSTQQQQQLLQVLDLSSNAFTGTIPPSAFNFCHKLEKLLLPNNFLSGPIPAEIGNCKNLMSIDLSFNCLSGPIPSQIWNLPNLSELVMWANNLTGEIPQGICEDGGGNLEMLILNNNLITGTIPPSIAKCTDLIWVSLSNNHLTGDIPDGIGHLLNLAILQLGNNSLSGKIPPELGNCRSLIWLDLNSNNLSGSVPLELAYQSGLVTPGLVSGKQFAFVRNEGGTACRGAGGLVEFEGVRPGRLASHPMVHSCASTRIYTGLTVYSFTSNGTMIYLDLSYNALTGLIPDNFGSMNYLQVLNLGHNMISGKIPDSFGGLKAIGVLDLSHNYLQGFVPGSLGTLSFLSDLDVSNNNLTGLIPTGGQLTTFPASRYENNSGLCGLPLPPCSSGSRGRPTSFRARGEKQSMAAAEMVIGITVSLLCILGLTFALYRMKKRRRQVEEKRDKYIESLPSSGSSSWKLSSVPEPSSIHVATFEKPLQKLTFAHLLEATNGFSSDTLIGSGGFGEVYKAQLSDGCVVAIKKLIHVTGQGDREFMAEMETIGKIKHRNLVPLLGYCKIGEERLLVYEYMKWGSLEAVLHDRAKAKGGGGSKLDWSARKKISIGSARGLAFLHHSCIPHIIHRDMKSSNVLLDENFEARVSDFGMARLVNALDTHLSVSTLAGTPGYVPPEYYQSFRCTTKGDVYSYGVILLELLAGKRPIDPLEFGDDNNLVGWAKQLQRENRSNEILDPELVTQKSGEAELYQYLKIAFECLEDRPFRRPTMIQVMAMFKELQIDTENDILDGFLVKETVIEESREKEVSS